MAEFLIYNKDHWMDNINQEEYNKLVSTPQGQYRYLMRYQRGDFVEVREDNAPHTAQERQSFIILKVPEISKKDALYLQVCDKKVMMKRRQYRVDITNLSQANKDKIDAKQSVSMSLTEFNAVKVKKSG